MMRLPRFRYHAPATLGEAAAILQGEGSQAMVVAGGTDLYPNMKRRHQTPKTLIGLRKIDALRGVKGSPARGLWIGPATILTDLEESALVREHYPGLYEAIHSISTPILRNMGTIGGNICLDTRCNYYNQNYEWRRAINFCMKCDGDTCWVAPGSDVCLAVSSSDTAPILCAFGARIQLVSKKGTRTIEAKDLYRRDGIDYLTSDYTKSEMYLEVVPLFSSKRVELLDDKRLAGQLIGLERRVSRGGRDSGRCARGRRRGRDDSSHAAGGRGIGVVGQNTIGQEARIDGTEAAGDVGGDARQGWGVYFSTRLLPVSAT